MKIKKPKFSTPRAAKALQTRIRNANSGKSDPIKEFRLLVSGSRDWPMDKRGIVHRAILQAINDHQPDLAHVLVIVGEADGVDTITRVYCSDVLGVACAQFHAPWEQHRRDFGSPRAAGPKRNGWMLRWGRPDYVLAFHPYLINSRGTKNLCEQARARRIPIKIITGSEK